jgi:hypothetical protein
MEAAKKKTLLSLTLGMVLSPDTLCPQLYLLLSGMHNHIVLRLGGVALACGAHG